MPPKIRFRTARFEEWERQLAFAPEATLRRQMDAAAALIPEIDRAATYPFEFVQWRVTGYRAEDPPLDAIDGATLQAELGAFVQRISERVIPLEGDREGGAIALADLAAEWGVSEKTLRRWRDRGLVSRRIRFADGRARVGCYRADAEAFASRQPELIAEARDFSRLDPAARRAAIDAVRRLVAEGRTPNLAAREVARALGRAHESIRRLLAARGELRAGGRGDRTARERRFAYRAWRYGVPIERIAERLGGRPDAARRRIDAARAEVLRGLRLAWIEFATFSRPDADETILAAPATRRDLAPRLSDGDGARSLATMRVAAATATRDALEDEAILAAFHWLKRRADGAIRALGRVPDRASLDRIETDLRWASLLHRRLLERWLPIAVERIQHSLDGKLLRRPGDEIRRLLEATVAVIADVVAEVDPSRRQVPRRVVALETERLLARLGIATRRERAGAKSDCDAVPLGTILDRVAPWGSVVGPLAPTLPTAPDAASILARRLGLDGGPPRTMSELAAEERTTVSLIARRLSDAEAARRREHARN
jgi:hypothetical protein